MAIGTWRVDSEDQTANDGPGWRRPPQMPLGSRFPLAAVVLPLVLILAACGDADDDDEPTATAPAAAAAIATAPAAETGPGPDVSPAATPTTVGDIAARIDAAWAGVTTYRANEVTFATDDPNAPPSIVSSPIASPIAPSIASPGASPVAGSTAGDIRAIDEVVLPDRKHRRIVEGDEIVSEIIVIAGQIYARGEFVRQYVDPALPPETWVQLDLTNPPTNSEIGEILIGLVATIGAPLSALPPDQLDLPVTSIGQTVVDGRTCDVYQVVQTTVTGERIDVAIGIDATGLPCLIETRAGGQVTLATYVAFNEPIEIATPAEFITRAPIGVGTPAATPEPAPGG